jgi:hypothetical protein
MVRTSRLKGKLSSEQATSRATAGKVRMKRLEARRRDAARQGQKKIGDAAGHDHNHPE